MKKQKIKNLRLGKSKVANLKMNSLNGGVVTKDEPTSPIRCHTAACGNTFNFCVTIPVPDAGDDSFNIDCQNSITCDG